MPHSDTSRWPEMEWLAISDSADARSFLLALALLAVLLGIIAPASVWRLYAWAPEAAILRYDRIRVMHRLATEFVAIPPQVLVVGGSQMRELLPADTYTSDELNTVCGRPVAVLNGATTSQLPSASIALIEHFRRPPPELVLIAINPSRLHHGGGVSAAAVSALPLPTIPVRARVEVLWTDIGLIDDARRIWREPGDDPFQAAQHRYRGEPWPPERKRFDAEQEVRIAMRTPRDRVDRNVDDLVAVARAVAARGGHVMFVVPPHSPEAEVPYRAYAAQMTEALARLRAVGEVLDLRGHPALTQGDFYDAVHLVRSGRRKLWPELRTAIARALPECSR